MRPDQEQEITRAGTVHLADEAVGGADGFAIDLEDDVTGLQAGIFGGAAGTDLPHDCTVNGVRSLDLLTRIGGKVTDSETELTRLDAGGARRTVVFGYFLAFGVKLADGEVNG